MKPVSPVTKIPFIGYVYAKKLERLDIFSIKDLLFHVPSKYNDYSKKLDISKLKVKDISTIEGVVDSVKNQYTKSFKIIQTAQISDGTGSIKAIWFNQPFLTRTIKKGARLSLSGKTDWFGREKVLISPEYEIITPEKQKLHTGRIVPVYPETKGLSSKWLRSRISYALEKCPISFIEYLPEEILQKYKLPDIKSAINYIHFPNNLKEAESGRKRLAFEELFFLHIKSLMRKINWKKNKSSKSLKVDKKEVSQFIESLPFKLTESQTRSVDELLNELDKDIPMNRLLEGDVGSGKTVVAAVGCFVCFLNGFQSVIMAPTQILAEQHYQTMGKFFSKYKIRLCLVTSSGIKKDTGNADIIIGTHALLYNKNKIDLKNSAYVVIDEQHRFGVEQRAILSKKSRDSYIYPHVLTMTATPIPRTVALTLYGDLDLSTLDELPKGRKKITTWLVPPEKREDAYKWIEKKIKNTKVQAFIICPLIEESEKETMKQVKGATQEFERVKKIFPRLKVGLLHGKLKPVEKNSIIENFRAKKTDILVSTPVVEVGVDIPNATIMVIEAAERFGLAQLHQLRGRVGRGEVKSFCLLFTESKSKTITTRLSIMQKTLSGFKLAELDLKLRGPGEILGVRQHGFTRLKAASWSDLKMIKITKDVAREVIENPEKYPKFYKKADTENISLN